MDAKAGKADKTALPILNPSRRQGLFVEAAVLVTVLASLIAARVFGYLLFHSLAELYSTFIAVTYFIIAWHTRRNNENPPIAVLGFVYLFVAILDVFHTLSYVGMGVFTGYQFPANQVWVIARFMEALGLLLFTFAGRFEGRKLAILMGILTVYMIAGLALVFVFRAFPACYITGIGQTPFKVAMEIVIVAILSAAALALVFRRSIFPRAIYLSLLASIAFTILSELSFMLYLSNYDWVNMLGHYLKILSFYLVYRSMVTTGLERPQELLYHRIAENNEELQRANEAKDIFIAILSHDLRNPLWGIKGLAESLAEDRAGMSDAQLGLHFRSIARTAASSLNLVEDVLSWARGQAGNLEPSLESLDLRAVVKEQVDLFTEIAGEKGVRLSLLEGGSPVVRTDRNMLAVIVRNLVQNAIKFTAQDGSVAVAVEKDGDSCVISVVDSGRGLSEAQLASVFSMDANLRTIGTDGERSSGLGLALAARFAQELSGSLEASSSGQGATFRLRLP
ncbi:MAG: MASE3 domain-containing protein [Spirochaetota bacterium]